MMRMNDIATLRSLFVEKQVRPVLSIHVTHRLGRPARSFLNKAYLRALRMERRRRKDNIGILTWA